MKKYLYLLVCVLVCFMFACSPYKSIINSESEHREIVDSGEYYRIYKENINQVCYDIYDSKGKIVLSEITDRPLKINMVNDDIVDIEIVMGTGITIHKYYGVEENCFSREFLYVLTNSDKLVAYIAVSKEKPFENRKIIVQDIFDKNSFCKEFQLDFSDVDTPVMEAMFSKDGTSLQLTYLSGEEQKQISTILSLIQ